MSMTSASIRIQKQLVPSFHVALHAGRLIELRINGPVRTSKDIEDFGALFREKIASVEQCVIICADYRNAPAVLSPERAEEWGELMRSFAHRIERSAILIDKQRATFNLQLQRVVMRVGYRERKLFFDDVAAKYWLSEKLTDVERARLNRFVSGMALF